MPSWSPSRLGPGWHGPFDSKQAALDYYAKQKAGHPNWREPTGIVGNVGNVLSLANPVTAAETVGADLVQTGAGLLLNIQSLMIRLGEILLGLVLIGVGVAQLTGADNFLSSNVKAAGKLVKYVR